MLSFLLGADVSPDAYNWLMVLKIVMFILLALCAITIIVCIVLQNNSGQSGNVLGGSQETYYSKNKGSTREGILKIITIVCASVIFVIAIALTIMLKS